MRRSRYHTDRTAVEHRIIAYHRAGVSLSRYQQEADLKDLRAEIPEYAAIHSPVLQGVLSRLDKTSQAFFRRLQAGEKAGFSRYEQEAEVKDLRAAMPDYAAIHRQVLQDVLARLD